MKKLLAILLALALLTACRQDDQQAEMNGSTSVVNNESSSESAQGDPAPTQTPPAESSAQGETQLLALESGSIFFKPTEFTVKVGKPVRIEITNSGVHTFQINELGINEALVEGMNVVEFTPDKAGSFEFYCGVAAHRQRGQKGTLTVTE